MLHFFEDFDEESLELTTKFGIDKLSLMLEFMRLLEDESEESFHVFVGWLESKINRKMTDEESLALAEGTLNYVRSNEATDDRLVAMKYIFGLEFLTEQLGDETTTH